MAEKGVRIRIVSESVGKGFKDANKSLALLKKTIAGLGILSATKAIASFGLTTAKAFIADEKAANRLAVAVKNLGLGFETPRIEAYISELSKLTGVTDDQLRPAMQKLLQTTGSVTKAQELLTQATDISAGSGIDYETVVNDLSKAYVGQTRGLSKYALGVSVAELKTMKFAEVQDRLNKAFSGANAEYLTTYAGKLQLITTAAGEASEKIGGALVESLVSVFAAGDTTQFVNQIDTLATKIADTVASVVFGFQKLYVLTSDRAILASFNPFDNYEKNALAAIEAAEKAAKFKRNAPAMGYAGSQPLGIYETAAQIAARKKAEADALKRAKALAGLQTKSLADAKKKAALDKASKTLNLEAIGIEAALKGKISETDKLSLLLQKAILEGNDVTAKKLTDQLDAAIKRQKELEQLLLNLPKTKNPFEDWKIPKLDFGGNLLGTPVPDFKPPYYATEPNSGGGGMGPFAPPAPPAQTPITVVVEVDKEVIATAITSVQTNQSLSGSFIDANRLGRFAQVRTPQ
ncbi:hypothetical protein UFOVP538_26 [uncultured Caudovirales phage]|uniref:Uncharacterized protein n=1 Tax=uncultured Caudovirales phage TaxID=2100421 RepID=A0A6J5MQ81_9CAUD|nr:hypothetical protein UFOVP538_26 [uncultured Caudovirales phage]